MRFSRCSGMLSEDELAAQHGLAMIAYMIYMVSANYFYFVRLGKYDSKMFTQQSLNSSVNVQPAKVNITQKQIFNNQS